MADVGQSVSLVLAGHLGYAADITPYGSTIGLGGSGYGCWRGATVAASARIGLAAQMGEDISPEVLQGFGMVASGVLFMPGPSPRFEIIQEVGLERRFSSVLGAAANPEPRSIIECYPNAEHVHLATMPPWQQIVWFRACKELLPQAKVSVDMFEATVKSDIEASLQLCSQADLIFMNEVEFQLLGENGLQVEKPMLLKRGGRGAIFTDGQNVCESLTRCVKPVDTTGAGEILAGAFLALRDRKIPLAQSLKAAVSIATASVTEFGVDGPRLKACIEFEKRKLDLIGDLPAGVGDYSERRSCARCNDRADHPDRA